MLAMVVNLSFIADACNGGQLKYYCWKTSTWLLGQLLGWCKKTVTDWTSSVLCAFHLHLVTWSLYAHSHGAPHKSLKVSEQTYKPQVGCHMNSCKCCTQLTFAHTVFCRTKVHVRYGTRMMSTSTENIIYTCIKATKAHIFNNIVTYSYHHGIEPSFCILNHSV